MKAAITVGDGEVQVVERPDPRSSGIALVRVTTAGICGTDLKVLGGKVAAVRPVVLGHEVMGRVEVPAPGSGIPAGARVVIDPSVHCGRCHVCLRDLPHLCRTAG